VTKEYLESFGIRTVEQPPYLPDLNRIQHMQASDHNPNLSGLSSPVVHRTSVA
jgi:hypothetical protein